MKVWILEVGEDAPCIGFVCKDKQILLDHVSKIFGVFTIKEEAETYITWNGHYLHAKLHDVK